MAFPATPLDVRTELQIGAAWTDVSADTYLRDLITISRGRADEASRPDPSKCTITFNNRLGKYSPRNPLSPYYGLIGRNTPIRVSVPASSRYLRLPGDAGARASTPDAAALDITGDIDIRIDLTLANWHPGNHFVDVLGKAAGSGNQSWRLSISPAGAPYFAWWTDGVNDPVAEPPTPLPVPPSGRLALRVTLDVDNGAGGWTASFYTAPSGTAGPWTLLGTVTGTGVTSIFNSTAALEVGDISGTLFSAFPVGRVHAVEVRNGIGGSVVASPVFSTPAAGAGSFVDGAGRTWTMSGGAEISDRNYRFHGEVSAWPPKWDVSGNDRYVPVEAAGPRRRYGTGTSPLQSTLRRRIPSDPSLQAYWPMEEDRDATRAYSPLPGVKPMQVKTVTFAADDSLAGSKALPSLTAGATFSGDVPGWVSTGQWHLEHVYRLDTAPAAYAATISAAGTGTVRAWTLSLQTGAARVQGYDVNGALLVDSAIGIGSDLFGKWTRQRFTLSESGGTVTWTISWTVVGGTGGSASGSYSGTAGTVTRVYTTAAAGVEGMRIGHIAVFTVASTSIFDNADTGFAGEQAHVRVDRLAAEEGIPFTFPAGTGSTAAMGPQRPGTVLDLLDECADADMGILHEHREVSRPAFRRRTSLYNQPAALALDYAVDGHVAPPLEPVDDDQAARNDITVSRTGGSSAHLTQDTGPLSVQLPPNGIGPVPGGGTVNVATDDQLPDVAGWLLHLGTWDDSRYPSVHVDLSAAPSLIDTATAVDVGDRITIAHPPPEAGGAGDTLDLLVQGYTETLGLYGWDLVYNCTPGAPWRVAVLDDTVLGRADTDGSQLATAVTSTATALPVLVTAGPPWTTDPAEFPLDLQLGGEVVTATACAPWVNDTFTRTTSSSWGTATSGQAWTQTGGAASDYSVNGSSGLHSLTSVSVGRATTIGSSIADFDVVASFSTSALAVGASHFVFLVSRWAGANDFLAVRVEFTTSAGVIITIRKRVGGVDTQLSTKTTALTHAAGTLFRARFAGSGTAFQAKVWLASTAEPAGWDTAVTDASITAAGPVGVRTSLGTGNTNTLPVTAAVDDFALLNPQVFTVTRSTNGVVKSQAAGTDVELANPMTLAL